MCFDAISDFLESGVNAPPNGQRRKVRIRRNLNHRWVLLNCKLFSDLILPPGVALKIDWVKPSITVLELPGGGMAPDLDLERVLNQLLRQCGMRRFSALRSVSADSLPDGDEPDQLDPPQWSTRIVALLEKCEIAIPLRSELHQIYRGTRARFGRTIALRVYYRQLMRGINYGSSR